MNKIKYKKFACKTPCIVVGQCERLEANLLKEDKLHTDAITLLNDGLLDGALPTDPSVQQLLNDVRTWWVKTQEIAQNNCDEEIQMQTAYASNWCISLAKDIVISERLFIGK